VNVSAIPIILTHFSVARSGVCHTCVPGSNYSTDLHAIWLVQKLAPMTHCVRWPDGGPWRPKSGDFGVTP